MESIYGEAPEGVETPEGWERFPAGVDQWFRRPLRGEGVVTNRASIPDHLFSREEYTRIVKVFALFLLAAAVLFPDEREGNFNIRFEPAAVLQTGVAVPFEIHVTDNLHKPVQQAKVTLYIETSEHTQAKKFPAPATEPGLYLAKPIFPETGAWNVRAEVRLSDRVTSRILEFSVAK
jgi:hypothetical protein